MGSWALVGWLTVVLAAAAVSGHPAPIPDDIPDIVLAEEPASR